MTQPCERQLICTYTEVIGLGQQRINSQDNCPNRIVTIVACCSIDDCRCAIEYMTQPCERQLICTYTEVIGLGQQRRYRQVDRVDRITTACCTCYRISKCSRCVIAHTIEHIRQLVSTY